MTFALVIMLFGGTAGGRVVNTDLRFTTMSNCDIAAAKVMAGGAQSTAAWTRVVAVCVEVQR